MSSWTNNDHNEYLRDCLFTGFEVCNYTSSQPRLPGASLCLYQTKRGNADNPTTEQFRYSLKAVKVNRLLQIPTSKGENTETSSADILALISNIRKVCASTVVPPFLQKFSLDEGSKTSKLVVLPDNTYEIDLRKQEVNVTAYVAGHIIRKYLSKYSCIQCVTILTYRSFSPRLTDTLTVAKAYDISNNPSEKLIKACDIILQKMVK